MNKQCRVLVTGAGSGVGQGIIKALRLSQLPVTIVSADIALMNVALYRTDEAVIVPRVEMVKCVDEIIEVMQQNKIDVVMLGSEFDLDFYSKNRSIIEKRTGSLVIVAPPETVHIAGDKWLTAEFLRKNGIPYAEAFLPDSPEDAVRVADEWGYPVMLKARCGTSSRYVHIINRTEELLACYAQTPRPMLQKVVAIPSPELQCEYTCSIFKTMNGRMLGPFTARRTIRGGDSWHIEVSRFSELNDVLMAIGKSMNFIGSINVQLMLTKEGPVPFEINARFSGTTAVRAHFGFNEPEMALRTMHYHEEIADPIIRSGLALRYHEEVFIEDVLADDLRPGIHKGKVNIWF